MRWVTLYVDYVELIGGNLVKNQLIFKLRRIIIDSSETEIQLR